MFLRSFKRLVQLKEEGPGVPSVLVDGPHVHFPLHRPEADKIGVEEVPRVSVEDMFLSCLGTLVPVVRWELLVRSSPVKMNVPWF